MAPLQLFRSRHRGPSPRQRSDRNPRAGDHARSTLPDVEGVAASGHLKAATPVRHKNGRDCTMDIAKDPATVAVLDQHDAERTEADSVAPLSLNRSLLRKDVTRELFRRALKSYDDDPAYGPVPVLRIRGGAVDGEAVTYKRDGAKPVADDLPVWRCNSCNGAQARPTPFWINAGHVIVQIDLCSACASHAFTEGAIPQSLRAE